MKEKRTEHNGKKRATISGKVIKHLIVSMVLINLFLVIVVSSLVRSSISASEEKYLTEIVSNISSTINQTVLEYIAVAEVIAQSQNIATLLQDSNQTNKMVNHKNMPLIIKELSSMVDNFHGVVINICVMDVEQDSYVLHNGIESASDFSFQSKSYYKAVQNKQTMVTEPYQDTASGSMVVSIASPVLDDNNNALGIVLIDLSTDFISQLVRESGYGETGRSLIVDENNTVLAYSDTSYIGLNYSNLGITGSAFSSELANPTSSLVEYQLRGVNRIGAVGSIGTLGWKIITGMNTTEFNNAANSVGSLLISLQAASVLFNLVLCGITIYNLLKPIEELNLAMKEVSKGNLHYQVHYQSNDEIGELSDNIRLTIQNLALYIDEIEYQLHEFGEGNFTVESKMEFVGDFVAIQNSIAQFRTLISQTLTNLKSTVEQVTVGSDYVATGSQNLAEGSARQSDSIHNLNSFIANITERINENATKADEVNNSAQEISKELISSNQKMSTMLGSMKEIHEKSEGIKKIVKTIEDVAFQTNILALNAAVEAARAGESGRGFSVVAEEVRSLSKQTSEAVKNTRMLITETTTAVDIGYEIADGTATSLEQVTVDITNFIETLEEIAQASLEQATAIDKINRGVGEISSVMQTNSAISEESAATSEELSSQATEMKNSIGRFKTS